MIGAGLSELGLREEDKAARLLVGDSWFASTETAAALTKEKSWESTSSERQSGHCRVPR
jgi:hypothetical protein